MTLTHRKFYLTPLQFDHDTDTSQILSDPSPVLPGRDTGTSQVLSDFSPVLPGRETDTSQVLSDPPPVQNNFLQNKYIFLKL